MKIYIKKKKNHGCNCINIFTIKNKRQHTCTKLKANLDNVAKKTKRKNLNTS